MYVGLKQPHGDGERYVTPARAAAKETKSKVNFSLFELRCFLLDPGPVPDSSPHLKLGY